MLSGAGAIDGFILFSRKLSLMVILRPLEALGITCGCPSKGVTLRRSEKCLACGVSTLTSTMPVIPSQVTGPV